MLRLLRIFVLLILCGEKRLNKHISSFNFTSKAFYKHHWDEQIEETVSHHTKFANKFTKEFRHWLIMFCYDHEITDMPVIIDALEHSSGYPHFLL